MMKSKIFLIACLFVFLNPAQGSCQEGALTEPVSNTVIKDPFDPWLPKIEEKIEMPPEEIKIDVARPPDVPPVIREAPVAEVSPPLLRISGLVWNTAEPQAIINDNIVKIGDIVQDSKILNIHKDGVDVMFLNKIFTIEMEKPVTSSI